jgi:hypothetical protein
MAVRKDDQGGGDEPFTPAVDRFTGGITAPRRRVVDCQDCKKPQPEFSDERAAAEFNVKSEPAGTFKKGRT